MVAERALDEPDVGDDALVRVVVGVEDQGLERRRRVALRRRDALDDRLEDLVDAGPVLGRGEDDLLARDREDVLELLDDDARARPTGRSILLMTGMIVRPSREREVDVGERLGLDALRGVDDEDRALAGLEAAADLVAEVDVAGRVDQVQPVGEAVLAPCTRAARRAP